MSEVLQSTTVPLSPPDTADAILAGIATRLDRAATGEDVPHNVVTPLKSIMAAAATNMSDASPDAIDLVILGLASALQPLADRFGKALPVRDAQFALHCAAAVVRTFGTPLPDEPAFDRDTVDHWLDAVAITAAQIDVALRLERMHERTLARGWGERPISGGSVH